MALAQAILVTLLDNPCSGYDLAKQFDSSIGFFWSASHQQIYRELSKLETQGVISCQTVPQAGKPDKKLYSVTELGKQHLQDWLAQPCEPAPTKEDLLIKIFAGNIVPRGIMLTELKRHQKLHAEKLAIYKNLEQRYFLNVAALSESAKFQYLTLANGMSYETHWLAWCEQAIHLLERG